MTVDLRANKVTCHVDVDAPKEGRPPTRVNWLVRQLKHAPDALRVEAFQMHARGAGAAALLKDVRKDPAILVADPKKELRAFRVALTVPVGSKRGRGRGSFIDSVVDALNAFYADVVQHLKAWAATPPKMREPDEVPAGTQRALVSTAFSSQDGSEPPDAPETRGSGPDADVEEDAGKYAAASLNGAGATSETGTSGPQSESEFPAASAPALQ